MVVNVMNHYSYRLSEHNPNNLWQSVAKIIIRGIRAIRGEKHMISTQRRREDMAMGYGL